MHLPSFSLERLVAGPSICYKPHDLFLGALGVLFLEQLHVLPHKLLILTWLAGGPRYGLRLHQLPFAGAATLASRIDALGMSLEFGVTIGAFPYVFEVDIVRVLGGHLDTPVAESPAALRCPHLEFLAVWAVSYTHLTLPTKA